LSQEQVPFKVHARGSIGVAFGLMPRGEMQTERGRVITRTSMPFFSKEGHAGSGQRLTRDKKAAWVLHYAAAAATRFPQHSITERRKSFGEEEIGVVSLHAITDTLSQFYFSLKRKFLAEQLSSVFRY
jgi:hypothetical protein